jgi:hypothetical protein
MEPEPLHDAAPTAPNFKLDIKCHKLQHFVFQQSDLLYSWVSAGAAFKFLPGAGAENA